MVTTVFQHAQCLIGGTAKRWSPSSIEVMVCSHRRNALPTIFTLTLVCVPFVTTGVQSQAQTAFTNILAGQPWNGANVDATFVSATGPPTTTKV